MDKFLYGASVQGIQRFIFQTNALREISGGSEMVEQICTDLFANAIGITIEQLDDDPKALVTAAGNIKYVFDNETKCQELVKQFPKIIMEFAPGITISQAVLRVPEDVNIEKKHIDILEKRLRTQRNIPFRPFDLGLTGIKRTRKTGLPAVEERIIKKEKTLIDHSIKNKLKINQSHRVLKSFFDKLKEKEGQIPWEMEDITKSKGKSYSWLAVVHADGNNMGIALQRLSESVGSPNGDDYIRIFRNFSKALNLSTITAAKKAHLEVLKKNALDSHYKLPFRPIVIGGDDLTIICRADLALDFTKLFLQYFEEETKNNFLKLNSEFLKNGLTACAGIAFIKESYPFHYGYNLAETLCGEAKKVAKLNLDPDALTPSCLLFHKVQDSFTQDYKEIKKRELTANNIDFSFGPYYLASDKHPTIEKLQTKIIQLQGKEGNAIKSHLRQWLTDVHSDPGLATQKMNRLISAADNEAKKRLIKLGLPEDAIKENKSPIYDWLTIHSINQGGN